MAGVDVEAILVKMDSEKDEDLNWRQSIVDLMKLLDLDCSLNARKQLAQELGYTGALTGSAEMNVWLHKQVMRSSPRTAARCPSCCAASTRHHARNLVERAGSIGPARSAIVFALHRSRHELAAGPAEAGA